MLMVGASGPSAPAPHGSWMGARHRRLQLQWWPLPDLATNTPRRSAIDVFNFDGGRCRILPPAPPRGPAIDVFNFGGGRCRILPLAPLRGAHHRRLQLWWWSLSNLAASTPRGPTIDVFNFGDGRYRTFLPATPGGAAIDVFSFGGGRSRTLPPTPSGGPPSTSSTLVVVAVGPCCQHPPGGPRHRCL
jgi:hypothetical protein